MGTRRDRVREGTLTWARYSAAALLFLSTASCLNPSRYGTPRTTPVGQIQHLLSVEYFSYRGVAADAYTRLEPYPDFYGYGFEPGVATGNTFSAPSYGFRVGLKDRLDLGVRLASSAALDTDLKWNFLRARAFDLAIDPGMQLFYNPEGSAKGPHALLTSPLIVGINASPSFSLVPSVGVAYSSGSESGRIYNDSGPRLAQIKAVFLQAGFGLDFRTSETFAVHPQLAMLRSLSAEDDAKITWYTFGIGFSWGKLPVYGAPEAGAAER